ncbi:MAG: hypothetical protein K2P81_08760 [Bacteriovoracaceae bacterium]|nr:hypothetical protein [Bacteriovoracaceae bacterium]
MRKLLLFLLTIVIFTVSPAFARAGEMTVIYHPQLKIDLKLEELVSIIKAKRSLEGHTLILDRFSKISETDLEDMLQLSSRELTNLWRVKFFTGRAMMLKQVDNIQQGIRSVQENNQSLYVIFGSKDLPTTLPDGLTKISFTN